MLIADQELRERHGWTSMMAELSFTTGMRYLVSPLGSNYPFVQMWPARSDRPAWYIAALCIVSRAGKEELRLNGRRSAVGDVALNNSLSVLGIVKSQSQWWFKYDPVVFEGHPWVQSVGWGADRFRGPEEQMNDIGIPTPVEFITEAPYATVVPVNGSVNLPPKMFLSWAKDPKFLTDVRVDRSALPVRKIMPLEEEE